VLILFSTVGSAFAEPTTPTPTPTGETGTGAMSDEARGHYQRGLALYGDKDYAGAIAELEAGYAIDPRREFLFAEAQALRLNGDCKGAVPLYKKFLDSRPDDVQTNATHIALGRCAEQMASKPAEVAAPAAGVAKSPSTALAATMPAPRAPPAPWYQDVAGGVLLGGGVAALAIGTAFTFAARSARDDANQSSSTYAEYAQHWATARERSHVAIGAFSVGAAFTGAAIYRYLRLRHRPPAAATGINVGVSGGGGTRGGIAVGIGGRF
jgi:tetratricopeptide (TPR) repeat protein